MDEPDLRELADELRSARVHLARYILGSAKDANGEFKAAELLIDSVIEKLDPDERDGGTYH